MLLKYNSINKVIAQSTYRCILNQCIFKSIYQCIETGTDYISINTNSGPCLFCARVILCFYVFPVTVCIVFFRVKRYCISNHRFDVIFKARPLVQDSSITPESHPSYRINFFLSADISARPSRE